MIYTTLPQVGAPATQVIPINANYQLESGLYATAFTADRIAYHTMTGQAPMDYHVNSGNGWVGRVAETLIRPGAATIGVDVSGARAFHFKKFALQGEDTAADRSDQTPLMRISTPIGWGSGKNVIEHVSFSGRGVGFEYGSVGTGFNNDTTFFQSCIFQTGVAYRQNDDQNVGQHFLHCSYPQDVDLCLDIIKGGNISWRGCDTYNVGTILRMGDGGTNVATMSLKDARIDGDPGGDTTLFERDGTAPFADVQLFVESIQYSNPIGPASTVFKPENNEKITVLSSDFAGANLVTFGAGAANARICIDRQSLATCTYTNDSRIEVIDCYPVTQTQDFIPTIGT